MNLGDVVLPQAQAIGQVAVAAEKLEKSSEDAFLHALARGLLNDATPVGARAEALREAWVNPVPSADLDTLAKENRLGEALLRTLIMVEESLAGSDTKLIEALSFLRRIGLEDVARRTAIQIVILEPQG